MVESVGAGFPIGLAAVTWVALAIDKFFIQDLGAEIDAFVADVDTWPGNQFAYLVLRLAAERAL